MVTRHQERALKLFRQRALGWERAASIVGISDATFDALVAGGYLEEKRDGPGPSFRWLRITDKGNRALDEGLW